MEVSGQFHALAGDRTLKAGWTPETVWTRWLW